MKDNLAILNYKNITEQVIEKYPNLLKIRGLIIELKENEIINLNNPILEFRDVEYLIKNFKKIDSITNKYDGCMVTSYRYNDKIYWATRNSFDSPIAKEANRFWEKNYSDKNIVIPNNTTLICEFIHKKTQILVKYDFEDFILIAVNTLDGYSYRKNEIKNLSEKNHLKYAEPLSIDIMEAINNVSNFTTNQEGYIITFDNTLKFKLSSLFYIYFYELVASPTEYNIYQLWKNIEKNDHKKILNILPNELLEIVKERFSLYENLNIKDESELSKIFQHNIYKKELTKGLPYDL